MEKINNGGVTDEQIKMWKNQYRKVYEVTITDEDEIHSVFFKRPDMATMSAVNKISKDDSVKAAEILYSNCFVGGSSFVQADAVLMMSAVGELTKIMESAKATLKNL